MALVHKLILKVCIDARQDAKECIALEPGFIKGYSRKGHLEFFMKDYDAALETYEVHIVHELIVMCMVRCTWGCQVECLGMHRMRIALVWRSWALHTHAALCAISVMDWTNRPITVMCATQAGLKQDPNSEELKEGIRRTITAMNAVGILSSDADVQLPWVHAAAVCHAHWQQNPIQAHAAAYSVTTVHAASRESGQVCNTGTSPRI